MRTREEIQNDLKENGSYYDTDFMLEVLLDIRSLLEKLSTPHDSKSHDAPLE